MDSVLKGLLSSISGSSPVVLSGGGSTSPSSSVPSLESQYSAALADSWKAPASPCSLTDSLVRAVLEIICTVCTSCPLCIWRLCARGCVCACLYVWRLYCIRIIIDSVIISHSHYDNCTWSLKCLVLQYLHIQLVAMSLNGS